MSPEVDAAMVMSASMRGALDHHAILSVTDRDGVITDANERFCAVSGYAREELIGRKHSLLKSGRHGDDLYRDLWRTISSGQVWHGVFCNRRKNGGIYWVQSTIVPQLDAQGDVCGYISIRTDVTDRLLVQEHASTLTSILDLSDQCVVMADLLGRITYTNHAAEVALGQASSVMQGRSILDFMPTPWARRCQARLQTLDTCDFKWRGLLPLLRPDGSRLISRSHVGVVADASGRPASVFNIFSDDSSEVARQAALRQAKAHAEQTSAAKSALLSNTSHELRTPLNAILGFAQLLARDISDPRHSGYVREIQFAGLHLKNLIDGILDLAKMEAGHDMLQLQAVDIAVLMRECLCLLQPLACDKEIDVVNTLLYPVMVKADRLHVTQVLLNLLSNAIKYSSAKGVIHLAQRAAEAGRIRVAISDRGLGIRADQMTQLFKPFSRLDARAHGVEGAGIGLAISKKLVENMNGQIGAFSEAGQGSTFWIELPAISSHERQECAGG